MTIDRTSPSPFSPLSATLAERYRVTRELGRGGMATVYLAEDLRHHRPVAIKVLHPELSAVLGTERFLKEIELTASLQHPHILPLFDSGSADGQLFYVMPFVEGETLRARLERETQLPVADAIGIATEIADALDYAHRRGVVHRDVKPENVLLHDGHVVVADFGIALAVQQAGGQRMTQTGLSLGTPHYMAPEQAMGEKAVDARADVYALGAVTYEMLAGEPPFTGPTPQSIVARVMTERPRPLGQLRETVPPGVALAVETALAKLPADRFATAALFSAALTSPDIGASGARIVTPAPTRRRLATVAIATAAVGAAFVGGWLVRGSAAPIESRHGVRRALVPMSNEYDARGADVAVSADGGTIAVTDGTHLVARRLDRTEFSPVPNAPPGSNGPFLSDDGTRIGFTNGRDIVVQRLDGSDAVTVPGADYNGGAFLDDDRLLLADSAGLSIVRPGSGERRLVARARAGILLEQPIVVPGGRWALASAAHGDLTMSRIVRVDLGSGVVDTLPVGAALRPQVADGQLFFIRPTGQVSAVPFDARSAEVRGDPVLTGEQAVVARQGLSGFGVGSGVIAIGARRLARLVARAPDGGRTPLIDALGTWHDPHVSPNGQQILLDRDIGGPRGRDVWVLDLATHALARVTTVGDAHDPVWTPDGRRITYLSFGTPNGPIVTVAADGSPGQRLIHFGGGGVNPGQWLPDGSAYLAGLTSGSTSSDIVALSADGRTATPLVATRFEEHSPAISPDGRWLAYVSNESGSRQLYVRALRGEGRAVVSEGPGEEPVWSRDGRLFYIEHHGDSSRVIAARLTDGAGPRVAARSIVVEALAYEPNGNHPNWDLLPDGRLVVVEPAGLPQLLLVFDWRPPAAKR